MVRATLNILQPFGVTIEDLYGKIGKNIQMKLNSFTEEEHLIIHQYFQIQKLFHNIYIIPKIFV